MIEAVIFDMDGVLLDSEPFWQEAEIEVFARIGLRLNREDGMKTMGLRVDEVVDYWFKQNPWDTKRYPKVEIRREILEGVVQRVRESGEMLPGVLHSLAFLGEKNVKLALASSSDMRLIAAVLEKLDLTDTFPVTHSAEFEKYGKPHPAVYLSTAGLLRVSPLDCLAIEDSVNGVLAAKAARMRCVAVPEATMLEDPRFGIADALLASLDELDEPLWERLID